ncbi:unnamed protein product [Calicophoron daubneyi]|uniref:Spermatogenesis-associated protein 1 C-terminal domain-containing protein n=1 Tax=Calicophoron daubneyi TaxID=300641 RepID=A0AAV2TR86_CALDB
MDAETPPNFPYVYTAFQTDLPEVYIIDRNALEGLEEDESNRPKQNSASAPRPASVSVRPLNPSPRGVQQPGPFTATSSVPPPIQGIAQQPAVYNSTPSNPIASYVPPAALPRQSIVGNQPPTGQTSSVTGVQSMSTLPNILISGASRPTSPVGAAPGQQLSSVYVDFSQASAGPSPAIQSGDPALETIASAILNQREILLRLEHEQQRRLIDMAAQAEECRRREAEEREREAARQAELRRKIEEMQRELAECQEAAKRAKEELAANKKAWEVALESKQDEISTLRENIDLMRANSAGKDNAALAAAQSELKQLRTEFRLMEERYKEAQESLLRKRELAEKKLASVQDEVHEVRRKMSDLRSAINEPRPVEVQVVHEKVSLHDVGVEANFNMPPAPTPLPAPEKDQNVPGPPIELHYILSFGSYLTPDAWLFRNEQTRKVCLSVTITPPKRRTVDPAIDDFARLRRLRLAQERRRLELIKRLNQLYIALATRRTQVRDEWKRRYYVAKKQAPGLEERMSTHRSTLDSLMRRAIMSLRHGNPDSHEGNLILIRPKRTVGCIADEIRRNEADPESEIAGSMEKRREVTREEYRLAEVMLGLTKAIKLRTQAEAEGRLLVAELDRRRGEMNLVKSTSPNRRAYVFSLSPRRQATHTRKLITPGSAGERRKSLATPRRSRLGSMMKLEPGIALIKPRSFSQNMNRTPSDSDSPYDSRKSQSSEAVAQARRPSSIKRPEVIMSNSEMED